MVYTLFILQKVSILLFKLSLIAILFKLWTLNNFSLLGLFPIMGFHFFTTFLIGLMDFSITIRAPFFGWDTFLIFLRET